MYIIRAVSALQIKRLHARYINQILNNGGVQTSCLRRKEKTEHNRDDVMIAHKN
jgi:hypothetical protein